MKINIITTTAIFLSLIISPLLSQQKFELVENKNGPTLGYANSSGVKILTIGNKKFKDLNKNGKLDKYEDWRLSVEDRAKDLAKKMSVEQIAGLMLYSRHQAIPAENVGYKAGTYNGKFFTDGNINPWELTDQQKKFLKEDNIRHVLITSVQGKKVAAMFNNNLQAFVESIDLGIPSNNSSDPRNLAQAIGEYSTSAEGQISLWPDGLGMAATFDPNIVEQFGQIAAKEYRALGITTALSPQIDLATEPRWFRIAMTFSESPELTRDMARAYIDGFQTSYGSDEIKDGWGYNSVNTMVKHWPGGGPEEGGRDAHWANGKFAVYPGNNLADHIMPFTEGALKLKGKTGQSSALMPYYTISYNQDKKYNENVGNSYNKYLITDLLREQYKYDGVVCTDWLITSDEGRVDEFLGKPWGVEKLSVAQRHYKIIMAGVDQFGGNDNKGPVIEAYQMGVKEKGEKFMRARFELSAIRLLKNIFRTGLFENPYLDPVHSNTIIGNKEFMAAGYDAQLKSIVLLKNKQAILPIKEKKTTVYVPKIYTAPSKGWWENYSQAKFDYPVNIELIKKYYNVTDDPNKADIALVFITSPVSGEGSEGYDKNDRKAGGNGYIPISLQYGTYTATDAREQSIAAGDPVIDPTITNRSYKGKTTTVINTMDLRTIQDTRAMMKDKPIIVSITVTKPMIFEEFEPLANGIIINFGVSNQAVLDMISGKYEPSGLLPIQMPANMKTVEQQKEDVPFDMEPHKDSEGHIYDFAYGLNWSGVINDARTIKYKRSK